MIVSEDWETRNDGGSDSQRFSWRVPPISSTRKAALSYLQRTYGLLSTHFDSQDLLAMFKALTTRHAKMPLLLAKTTLPPQ